MRKLICCTGPRIATSLAGAAAIVVALLAYPLGLDNNPILGPRRILLLAAGVVILVVQYALQRNSHGAWDGQDPSSSAEDTPESQLGYATEIPSRTHVRLIRVLLAIYSIVIVFIYSWVVVAGRFDSPPASTYYYSMLGQSFASGKLFLLLEPDPRLASLANPHDAAERSEIPRCKTDNPRTDCYLFDASYFRGRYYLYWGPAPAILLAGLRVFGIAEVGDATLALLGAVLLYLTTALCMWIIWRRYFSRENPWLLLPPILLAGLYYPILWVLDAPLIYEAAILLGAAFFMAGVAMAFPPSSSQEHGLFRLALIGCLWGLALATRTILAMPIAVMTIATLWRLLRKEKDKGRAVPDMARSFILAIPLLASIVLILAYNAARFSDPMEFGLRYVLTAREGQLSDRVFAPSYSLGNLLNYLAAPIDVERQFPFLRPTGPWHSIGPIPLPSSESLRGEPIAGLAFACPFLIFVVYLVWWAACGRLCDNPDQGRREVSSSLPQRTSLLQATIPLTLATIAGSVSIAAYYYSAARYLLDISPLLLLLAASGAWTAYAASRATHAKPRVAAAIVFTSSLSIVLGALLGTNNFIR